MVDPVRRRHPRRGYHAGSCISLIVTGCGFRGPPTTDLASEGSIVATDFRGVAREVLNIVHVRLLPGEGAQIGRHE